MAVVVVLLPVPRAAESSAHRLTKRPMPPLQRLARTASSAPPGNALPHGPSQCDCGDDDGDGNGDGDDSPEALIDAKPAAAAAADDDDAVSGAGGGAGAAQTAPPSAFRRDIRSLARDTQRPTSPRRSASSRASASCWPVVDEFKRRRTAMARFCGGGFFPVR